MLPGVDVVEAVVTSPSALGRYRHCPRLYRFLNVDGLWSQARTSPQQALGIAVHTALQDFYRLAPDRRGEDALVRAFLAAWHRSGGRGDPADRDRGVQALRRWYARADTALVPHATEIGLKWTWGDVTLKGRLDRVDRVPGGLRVVDYKTGMRPLTQERADADVALTVYAALVGRRLGEPVVELVLDYVVAGVQVRTARPEPLLGEQLGEVLAAARRMRDDTEYTPRTGPWCGRCDLLSRCPDGRAALRAEDGTAVARPAPGF